MHANTLSGPAAEVVSNPVATHGSRPTSGVLPQPRNHDER